MSAGTASELVFVGPHLWLDIRVFDGTCVARLVGDLDLATAPEVTRALRPRCSPQREGVVVDLRPLTFLDATGVRALLELQDVARRRRSTFAVVAGHGRVERVLRLTGADSRLERIDAGANGG